jgi:hypothetical protein
MLLLNLGEQVCQLIRSTQIPLRFSNLILLKQLFM